MSCSSLRFPCAPVARSAGTSTLALPVAHVLFPHYAVDWAANAEGTRLYYEYYLLTATQRN